MQKTVGENDGQMNLGNCCLNLETSTEIIFSQNIMCFVPNFLQFRSYSEEVLHFCLLAKLQQDVMCSSKSMIQSLLPLMKLYTQYPREMQLKAVEGQSAAQAPRQVGISTA